jgi:predicted lipid-binding transport protein (Tim44 family)
MGYDSGSDSDPNSSIFSRMSGKELGIIVVVALIGGFFAVQAMFGFPIKDIIIRKEMTEEARVSPQRQSRHMYSRRLRSGTAYHSKLSIQNRR